MTAPDPTRTGCVFCHNAAAGRDRCVPPDHDCAQEQGVVACEECYGNEAASVFHDWETLRAARLATMTPDELRDYTAEYASTSDRMRKVAGVDYPDEGAGLAWADPTSDREQLATVILDALCEHDPIGMYLTQPDTDGHFTVDGRADINIITDAILTRWRLVPVEQDDRCPHEAWQLDGRQRTCADCGARLSDDPTRKPRRINPTFIT